MLSDLGTCIAVGLYRFVKILEYETANPGADFNEKEAENFVFDEDNAATGADVSRPVVGFANADSTADRSGLSPPGTRDGFTNMNDATRLSSADPGIADRAPAGIDKDFHPGYQAAYQHAPNAEAGTMGGNYRPSSGRAAAPQLPGPVH